MEKNFSYKLINTTLFYILNNFEKWINLDKYEIRLFLSTNEFFFLLSHLRFSTIFYTTQLIDIFAYEIPIANLLRTNTKTKVETTNIIVYLFNSFFWNFSTKFFVPELNNNTISLTEFFLNGNWLEREVSELSGIFFLGKKDIRNLMLTYGDYSAPLRKNFPSIGIREVYYFSQDDLLGQVPITYQY